MSKTAAQGWATTIDRIPTAKGAVTLCRDNVTQDPLKRFFISIADGSTGFTASHHATEEAALVTFEGYRDQ